MSKYTLNDFAEKLKCHPRTVLRAVLDHPNPYWKKSYNIDLKIEEVARAYQCDVKTLTKIMEGKDSLLTLDEGAKMWGISKRAFFYRDYPVTCRSGRTTRYSKKDVIEKTLAHGWHGK